MVGLQLENGDNVTTRKFSDDLENVVDTEVKENLEKSTMRRVSWKIIPLFCVYVIVGQSEKKNLAFASQGLKDSIGISDSQYGLAASSFLFTYAAFTIPNTLFAKRVGIKNGMAVMMYGFGIVTLCTAFVGNYASLIVLRLLLGITESGGIQMILYHLSLFFGPERYAQAASKSIMLGNGLSSILGGPIAAAILAAFQGNSLSPWRWLFIIESLPCFIIATVVFILLPGSPLWCGRFLRDDQHEWLIKYTTALQDEKTRISSDLAEQNTSFWRVAWNPRVLLFGSIHFCFEFGLWALILWLPQLLRNLSDEKQMSMVTAALLTEIPYVLTTVTTLVAGWTSDRSGDRVWHGFFGLILGSLGALISAIIITLDSGSLAIQLFFLTLTRMGIEIHVTTFNGLQADIIPKRSAAAAYAIVKTIGSSGGIISCFLFGAIKQATGSFAVPMYMMAGILAVGAILAFQARCFLRKTSKLVEATEIEFSETENRFNSKGEIVARAPIGDEMA